MAIKINGRYVGESPQEQLSIEKSRFNSRKIKGSYYYKKYDSAQTNIFYEDLNNSEKKSPRGSP